MKILLIYPYWLEKRLRTEDVVIMPIGIYYVAALLRENGYDAEILNWHSIDETPHKIRETLMEKKPDVIGFSIMQANRWGGIEIARVAKAVNPDVKIVFGGPSPTFLWQHFLAHFPEIDFVVVGEGEYPFLNLIRCIEKADIDGIADIEGIAFRKDGRILKTKAPKPVQNLDQLPNPAKYFEYQHVCFTRGCPGKCKFCGSPLFWGPRVRSHSVKYFVEQLERLYRKGITFFYFSDDTFTFRKKDVIEICKKILQKKLDISWVAISRVDAVSEEVVYWMRKAGCIQISYGVESGSEKIRNILNKRFKAAQIETAFKITGEHGILPRAYFIYGCPGESSETIRETLDLIYKIKPLVVHFFILSLFPGTALYAEFKKKYKATDDVWLERIEEIKYFETDPDLSREQVLAFGRKLRSGYHAHLPALVDGIGLVDRPELFPLHSDFCSRLGMTFDHGDYSNIEDIRGKQKIAESLYTKALSYHPNSRAYLGLGILRQKAGDYPASIDILLQGVASFPDDMQLHLCLAISLMNTGAFDRALAHLLPFQHAKEALGFIVSCYEATGDLEKANLFRKKCR